MLGKVVTGKGVSLPAQSPLVSSYVRKKRTPFARANSPRQCSDCLALTELTWLCKPKTLYGEKLASWEVDPTPSRVTLLHEGKSHFWQSQLFVLHVNGLPSFKRNVGRLGPPRVAWVVY